MLKGIVLDFDGVIADTEPLHFRAFREVLAGEGVPLSEADYYSKYLGYSDAAAFNAIASDSGRSWDAAGIAALVGRKASRMKALETDGMPLFPGAEAFVRDAARIAPLAIASGALRAEILRVLQHANLISCFAAIVGAEDARASKPAPDPYLRAVELLAASGPHPIEPADCVAIEDSPWGLASARAAGLRTIAVMHSYNATDLSSADLVIASIATLRVTDLPQLWSQ